MLTKKYNYKSKPGRKSDNTEYCIISLNLPKKIVNKINENSKQQNLAKSKYVSQVLKEALEVSYE